MCVEVEVVDVPLDYNLLLERIWNYGMTMVVSSVFQEISFPHEGRIVTVDQLSFSRPNSSSGESMVLMINNLQQGTVNLGFGLFPSLLGTFNFPPPSNDVKYISAISN